MEKTHKTFSIIDTLSLLGELEHLRRHALLAAIATEDNGVPYLVLANQCQATRRKIQKHYFPQVAERDWCIVKSAARLLQIMEETANSDLEELRELKAIIDSAIYITTGEDISMCEACKKDLEEADSVL